MLCETRMTYIHRQLGYFPPHVLLACIGNKLANMSIGACCLFMVALTPKARMLTQWYKWNLSISNACAPMPSCFAGDPDALYTGLVPLANTRTPPPQPVPGHQGSSAGATSSPAASPSTAVPAAGSGACGDGADGAVMVFAASARHTIMLLPGTSVAEHLCGGEGGGEPPPLVFQVCVCVVVVGQLHSSKPRGSPQHIDAVYLFAHHARCGIGDGSMAHAA